MTMTNLEHTKALEAAATPGLWEAYPDRKVCGLMHVRIPLAMHPAARPADAEFIAHARTALPALVAAVERVQALHTPHRRPGHASDGTCESCYRVYPCPTIRVLEK